MLELTCALDASREWVFKALIDPAKLVKWWGPSGFTTPEIEIYPKVGGHYRLGMQPPDSELFHLAGEFLEIDAPTRLAYTFRWEDPDPDKQETVVRLSPPGCGRPDPVVAVARPIRHPGPIGAAQERLDRFASEVDRPPQVSLP